MSFISTIRNIIIEIATYFTMKRISCETPIRFYLENEFKDSSQIQDTIPFNFGSINQLLQVPKGSIVIPTEIWYFITSILIRTEKTRLEFGSIDYHKVNNVIIPTIIKFVEHNHHDKSIQNTMRVLMEFSTMLGILAVKAKEQNTLIMWECVDITTKKDPSCSFKAE